MLKRLVYSLFGAPTNRYFRFGARYLAKVPSAFAREIALEQGMDFIQRCEVSGDYLEFGVYKGRTFSAAIFLADERRLGMRYWAFDSFDGLPATEGEFQKGSYRCDQESFLANVRTCVGPKDSIRTVPGWFSESLKAGNPLLKDLRKVAIAWVDCDLYASTVPVLDFLTDRVQDGSLLFFDDWFNFKGRPDQGEQQACREWLQRNPQISLMPYSRFGWHGQSFIVHLVNQ